MRGDVRGTWEPASGTRTKVERRPNFTLCGRVDGLWLATCWNGLETHWRPVADKNGHGGPGRMRLKYASQRAPLETDFAVRPSEQASSERGIRVRRVDRCAPSGAQPFSVSGQGSHLRGASDLRSAAGGGGRPARLPILHIIALIERKGEAVDSSPAQSSTGKSCRSSPAGPTSR